MGSDSYALLDPVDIDLALDRLIFEDDWVPSARRTRSAPRSLRYDRTFEPTVRAGYLTAQEAVQRGDREVYIARLESRFQLPHDLALRVTDGRMRLKPAVEECERRRAATRVGRAVNWRPVAAALVLIVLAAGFFGASRLAHQRQIVRKLENAALAGRQSAADAGETAGTGSQGEPPGRVERNAQGWVTLVTAGHPADAMSTFCRLATPGAGCASADVLQSTPRFPGRRVGRFTLDDDERTWLIPIRRERGSGRWAIGTGLRPIAPTAEPPLDEGESSVWPYVPEFIPVAEG
jgi:hypothetical protein